MKIIVYQRGIYISGSVKEVLLALKKYAARYALLSELVYFSRN